MYSGVPISWNCVNWSVFSVSLAFVALAMPKSMTFASGFAVVQRDQDVRGLEVAVDDALLVGVLDGVANLREELPAGRARIERSCRSQYS